MTKQNAAFTEMSGLQRYIVFGVSTFQFRFEHCTSLVQTWLFYVVCEI